MVQIEKKPFYWLLFRLSDKLDADWHIGRMIITPEREFWLMLRSEDVAQLAPLRPQIKLDETQLLEHFDDVLGGAHFVHRGPIRETK